MGRIHRPRTKKKGSEPAVEFSYNSRIRWSAILFTVLGLVMVGRLTVLMIFEHDVYRALAAGSHEIYRQLVPTRGTVYIQDSRTKEEFPIAINRDYFILYADTRDIDDEEEVLRITEQLMEVFGYDEEKGGALFEKLSKENDPYEPIELKVDEVVKKRIEDLKLPGLAFLRKPYRYYPEQNLAAQVIGFVGKNEEGEDIGRYGIEGYWNRELAGSGGFFEGAKSATGGWIPTAGKIFKEANDGVDIVLTIDRTLQFTACERLRAAMVEYGAQSASLTIMDPYTGAILAMCSLPDFDPNEYGKVKNSRVFNNSTILTAYEPGSIFKPIAMAGAINEGVLTPNSVFHDYGVVEDVCDTPIHNALQKIYGDQTMIGVLENSINTGMVYTVEQLGKENFIKYVDDFGFGVKEGLELDTESAGTVETLTRNRIDKVDCYTATASFGQGITATPLQMVSAFSTIANGGLLMKPYIIDETRYPDGRVEKTRPEEIRRVITARTASLVGGMLVNVIDSGQADSAAVEGYYVAGKTGTAQIAGPGGYTEDTNHSFVGYAPVEDPKFVMIVKFGKPERAYSSTTAAPIFGDIAQFILKYYQVPPER